LPSYIKHNTNDYINSSDGYKVRTKILMESDGTWAVYYESKITVVYDGYSTGDSFSEEVTGLSPSTTYHYRSVANNTDGESYGSDMTFRTMPPDSVTNQTWRLSSGTLDLTLNWTKGNYSDYTLIRRDSDSYPSSVTDGTLVYNNTGNGTIDTSLDQAYLYTFWAYNSTWNSYSDPVFLNWSASWLNCYNETNQNNITDWKVEIANNDGSEVYVSENNNNSHIINISDLPSGNDVTFTFSADGYHLRTYTRDVTDVINLDAYLIPEQDDETIKTTSKSVSDPTSDLELTLDCEPSIVVSVQGWNESLYGHWFEIPEDKYSMSSTTLTVDKSMLDDNTSLVKITYYCDENEGVQYLLTVYGPQGEYGYNPPLQNALITVEKYMDDSESYEEISSVLTDGNGHADMFLIPNTVYRFSISKDGYENETVIKTPTSGITELIFRLSPAGSDTPSTPSYDDFWTDITITGTLHANNTIYITFSDSNSSTINTDISIYDFYNASETFISTDSRTGETSFSFWTAVTNSSHDHKLRLWFNTSANYEVSIPVTVIVYGVNKTWNTSITKFDLDARFSALFGDFELGYSNTICIVLALLVLGLFGPFHAGIGVITCGLTIGLMQGVFSVWTVNENIVLMGLSFLIMLLGILYTITMRTEETV